MLVELIADPPDQGDRLDELIERLDLSPHAVEPAFAALELVGLAEREGDVVRASLAASYFEYRWPIHLLTELARAELARRDHLAPGWPRTC